MNRATLQDAAREVEDSLEDTIIFYRAPRVTLLERFVEWALGWFR